MRLASALASGWVALERSTAIHRDPSNEGRRFIPLLLGDCKLPDTLRRYKYVDFREEANEDAAFAELLAVFRPEAGETPPTAKPAPIKKPSKKKPKPKAGARQAIFLAMYLWRRFRALPLVGREFARAIRLRTLRKS